MTKLTFLKVSVKKHFCIPSVVKVIILREYRSIHTLLIKLEMENILENKGTGQVQG